MGPSEFTTTTSTLPATGLIPAVPRLFSVMAVADQTGLCESFWRGAVRAKKIRHYKVGDRVLLAADDVAAFLAARAREAR